MTTTSRSDTPADPVPVPRHLSEEERALWENASGPLADVAGFKSSVLRSLLTALSSEREAVERARKDAERLDWLTRRMESCDDGVYAWGIIGLDPSIPSLRDAIDTASENDNA